MIKNKLYPFIEKYFSEYLWGFSKEQMNVGVVNGTIILEKLNIRIDKVNQKTDTHEMPFWMKSGSIQKIQVCCSLMNLIGEKPLEITIDYIDIILCPSPKWILRNSTSFIKENDFHLVEDYDPLDNNFHDIFLKKVNIYDGSILKNKSKFIEFFKDKSKLSGFLNNILNMGLKFYYQKSYLINLKIKNIHIRFEDDFHYHCNINKKESFSEFKSSNKKNKIGLGFTIQDLILNFSTDGNIKKNHFKVENMNIYFENEPEIYIPMETFIENLDKDFNVKENYYEYLKTKLVDFKKIIGNFSNNANIKQPNPINFSYTKILDNFNFMGNFGISCLDKGNIDFFSKNREKNYKFFFQIATSDIKVEINDFILNYLINIMQTFRSIYIIDPIQEFKPMRKPYNINNNYIKKILNSDACDNFNKKRKLVVRDWLHYFVWFSRFKKAIYGKLDQNILQNEFSRYYNICCVSNLDNSLGNNDENKSLNQKEYVNKNLEDPNIENNTKSQINPEDINMHFTSDILVKSLILKINKKENSENVKNGLIFIINTIDNKITLTKDEFNLYTLIKNFEIFTENKILINKKLHENIQNKNKEIKNSSVQTLIHKNIEEDNKNLIVGTSKSSLITNNSIPNMKISMKPSNSSSYSDLSSKLPIDDKNKNFLHINGNNNKLNNQIEISKNTKKFMAIDEVLGVNINVNDSDSFLEYQYNQGGNNNKIFIESILDKETIKIDYKKEKNFDISKFLNENKKLEFNNNQPPVFNANNKSNTIIDNKNNINNLIKLTVKNNDRNNYNNSPKNVKNISTSNNTRNLINVNVSNNIPAEQQNKGNILNLNKNNYQQIDFENDIKKKGNNLDNVEIIFNNQNTKIKNLNFQNIFKSKENLMNNQSNEIVTLNFLEISQIELNKNEKENFNLKKNEGKFSLQFFYNKKIQNSEINKNLLNSVVLIQDKLHLSTGDICLNLSNGNVKEIKEISTEIFRSKNQKEKNENNFFLNMNLEKDLFELRINMLEKLENRLKNEKPNNIQENLQLDNYKNTLMNLNLHDIENFCKYLKNEIKKIDKNFLDEKNCDFRLNIIFDYIKNKSFEFDISIPVISIFSYIPIKSNSENKIIEKNNNINNDPILKKENIFYQIFSRNKIPKIDFYFSFNKESLLIKFFDFEYEFFNINNNIKYEVSELFEILKNKYEIIKFPIIKQLENILSDNVEEKNTQIKKENILFSDKDNNGLNNSKKKTNSKENKISNPIKINKNNTGNNNNNINLLEENISNNINSLNLNKKNGISNKIISIAELKNFKNENSSFIQDESDVYSEDSITDKKHIKNINKNQSNGNLNNLIIDSGIIKNNLSELNNKESKLKKINNLNQLNNYNNIIENKLGNITNIKNKTNIKESNYEQFYITTENNDTPLLDKTLKFSNAGKDGLNIVNNIQKKNENNFIEKNKNPSEKENIQKLSLKNKISGGIALPNVFKEKKKLDLIEKNSLINSTFSDDDLVEENNYANTLDDLEEDIIYNPQKDSEKIKKNHNLKNNEIDKNKINHQKILDDAKKMIEESNNKKIKREISGNGNTKNFNKTNIIVNNVINNTNKSSNENISERNSNNLDGKLSNSSNGINAKKEEITDIFNQYKVSSKNSQNKIASMKSKTVKK